MKKLLTTLAILTINLTAVLSQAKPATESLTDAQIIELINKNRPSNAATLPKDLKYRLGATHVNGQYYLTDEPFIIEGAKKLEELGYGILKLWFYKADGQAHGYKYNSEWNLTSNMTLEELAKHKYYKQVFDMPFKVFCLNIKDGYAGASTKDQTKNLERVEKEFYDLTRYLLSKYKDRDVKFILSNWEGDWTLRGGIGQVSGWTENNIPANASIRVDNMIAWVKARQAGVDRARKDFGEVSCKVYNAVEVNKVYDGVEKGMPSITTHVLPKVKVDMVSWSAYDGKSPNGVKMYRGIDYLRQYMQPTDYMKGEKFVFIGEINEHENIKSKTKESVTEFCDLVMGVYLAQNIPYVFYWELYANDIHTGKKDQSKVLTAEQTRGNWIIRPDGSLGWAGEYLDGLLKRAARQ